MPLGRVEEEFCITAPTETLAVEAKNTRYNKVSSNFISSFPLKCLQSNEQETVGGEAGSREVGGGVQGGKVGGGEGAGRRKEGVGEGESRKEGVERER